MASHEDLALRKLEINFYHLTATPKLITLPKLLEKCLETKINTCVYFNDSNILDEASSYLWSFSSMTIIPHGKDCEEFAEDQLILLTCKNEYAKNNSKTAIYYDISSEILKKFNRIIFLFDGNNSEELEVARQKWKSLKSDNHEILYWKQDEKGSWSKQ